MRRPKGGVFRFEEMRDVCRNDTKGYVLIHNGLITPQQVPEEVVSSELTDTHNISDVRKAGRGGGAVASDWFKLNFI